MSPLRLLSVIAIVFTFTLVTTRVEGQRIKDLGRVEGVREMVLKGPGLVIGLQGTGDKERSPITREFFASYMESLGKEFDPEDLRSKNVAVVLVQAKVTSATKVGSRIDVTISSIGDAKSLKGGVLLETALGLPGRGVTGTKENPIVAVAQGPLEVSGETLTVGRGMGTLEKSIGMEFAPKDHSSFTIILDRPDFNTADRVARAVNDFPYLRYNAPDELPIAHAYDAGSITVTVPKAYRSKSQVVNFISKIIGEVEVPQVDRKAKVVIDTATGMVTVNGKVRVAEVVVLHRDMKISIARSATDQGQPYLLDVMKTLEDQGVTNEDLPGIIRSIDAAGALIGELVER